MPLTIEYSIDGAQLRAVTDGNHFFNRPGPRMVESAEILAEFLYPGRFDFGHRGRGWRYWNGHEQN